MPPIRTVILFLLLGLAGGCKEGRPMRMSHLVPTDIHGWRADGQDETYGRQTLFQYMDGTAEIFLIYGFRQVFVRRFVKEGAASLTVEVYDMGSSADAYGMFSFEREEERAGLGQGYEYAAGWLRFWKGPYFVSVMASSETPTSKRAVFDLGQAIARAIPSEGPRPALLAYLPAQGLIADSVRYFHTHTGLNYHYFLADQNLLHLDRQTEAVLARYRLEAGRPYLLLVRYPTPEKAAAARQSFVDAYLPEGGGTGMARLENGKWTAVKAQGEFLVAVFEVPEKQPAVALLETTLRGWGEKQP